MPRSFLIVYAIESQPIALSGKRAAINRERHLFANTVIVLRHEIIKAIITNNTTDPIGGDFHPFLSDKFLCPLGYASGQWQAFDIISNLGIYSDFSPSFWLVFSDNSKYFSGWKWNLSIMNKSFCPIRDNLLTFVQNIHPRKPYWKNCGISRYKYKK